MPNLKFFDSKMEEICLSWKWVGTKQYVSPPRDTDLTFADPFTLPLCTSIYRWMQRGCMFPPSFAYPLPFAHHWPIRSLAYPFCISFTHPAHMLKETIAYHGWLKDCISRWLRGWGQQKFDPWKSTKRLVGRNTLACYGCRGLVPGN